MVVKRKNRPLWGSSLKPNATLRVTDRNGVTANWNMQRTPRDTNSDKGRDGKRKADSGDGTGEQRVVNSQLTQSHRNQVSSKGNKSELALNKSGPLKLNQSKSSLDHGEFFNSSRWGSDTCLTNLLNTSSKGNLPPLILYLHFDAGSEENGSQSGEVPNIPPRESNPNRSQYNRRDSERPNRHHGLVRGRSNGGVEKHIPSNGGKCSSGLSVPRGRSTNHHAKSVLALLYGQAKVSISSKHSFSSTREAILDAHLCKKIYVL